MEKISFFLRLPFMRGITLLFWMGVIFLLSSFPGSGIDYEPPLWYVLERKSAHVFEYAVLAFLTFRFASSIFPKESFMRRLFLVGAFSITYGATDELHQFFVFGRGAQMTDVLIDGGGAILMISALALWRNFSKKKTSNFS